MHKLAARAVDRRVQAVQIQRVALVRAERIVTILHQALQLATAIAVLAVVFQYLAFALGAFPATRYLANHLFSIAVAPLKTMAQSAIDQVPNLVFLAVLAVVVRMGLRVLRVVFDAVERGAIRFSAFEPEWAQPTYKIVRFAIVAFAVVVAYPYMPGAQSAAFKGVSLFVGVLFSLGSSSAIANLIAGLHADLPARVQAWRSGPDRRRDRRRHGVAHPGDAAADGQERRGRDPELADPGGKVTNYSALARTQGLILHTMVGIGYETPWRQVEAMLLDRPPNARRASCAEPAPFVLQRALADFAVNYEIERVLRGRRCACSSVYTDAPPADPRRLQRVRRPDHDAGLRAIRPSRRSCRRRNGTSRQPRHHHRRRPRAGADRHVAVAHFDRLRAEEWGLRRCAFTDREYGGRNPGISLGQRLASCRVGAGEGGRPHPPDQRRFAGLTTWRSRPGGDR